jgi:hypothetical protein
VALFAVERPDGLLVDHLLDAGLRVLAMRDHPLSIAISKSASDELARSGNDGQGRACRALDGRCRYETDGRTGSESGARQFFSRAAASVACASLVVASSPFT